jgi:hypothetical protein
MQLAGAVGLRCILALASLGDSRVTVAESYGWTPQRTRAWAELLGLARYTGTAQTRPQTIGILEMVW